MSLLGYRCFFTSSAGNFTNAEVSEHADDAAAIAWAQQLFSDKYCAAAAFEIWQRERLVRREQRASAPS